MNRDSYRDVTTNMPWCMHKHFLRPIRLTLHPQRNLATWFIRFIYKRNCLYIWRVLHVNSECKKLSTR